MKLPPYPKFLDKTPININISDGTINEKGTMVIQKVFIGLCRYEEQFKIIRDSEGKTIQLIGKVFINGDIASNISRIEGYVYFGTNSTTTYKIYRSSRPRNPDGTIHHTELELM